MIHIPQCIACRHLRSEPDPTRTSKVVWRCGAFPNRIPRQMIQNLHDHREPYPGDNGVRWESVDPSKWEWPAQ